MNWLELLLIISGLLLWSMFWYQIIEAGIRWWENRHDPPRVDPDSIWMQRERMRTQRGKTKPPNDPR